MVVVVVVVVVVGAGSIARGGMVGVGVAGNPEDVGVDKSCNVSMLLRC